MTYIEIPQDWGSLVDPRTEEVIGPAGRDQWAYQLDHPTQLLTLPGGRQATVQDGPERLDCGHTQHEHLASWRQQLGAAARLVTVDMEWYRAAASDPTMKPGEITDVAAATLLAVAVLAVRIADRIGYPLHLAALGMIEMGNWGAAGTLSGVALWTRGHRESWDDTLRAVPRMTADDWGLIVALATHVANEAGMSTEDVLALAESLTEVNDHDHS